MAVVKNKDKKHNVSKSRINWPKWIMSVVIALISASVPGLIDLKKEQMKYMYEMKNSNVQHFYSETKTVERFGMEFVEYKIKSKPAVKGYHVIMYPYFLYKNNENRIIPVVGQFMKDEYVADEEGRCTLLRENTTDDLTQTVEDTMDVSVELKCLVAVKYVKNNEELIEVFDLKDGQLTESTEETTIRVLKAWQEKGSMKLDVKGWPDYNQSNLKDIFS